MKRKRVFQKLLTALLILCLTITCIPVNLSLLIHAAEQESFQPKRILIIGTQNPDGTELGQKVSLVASEFMSKTGTTGLNVVYGSETASQAGDLIVRIDADLGEQDYALFLPKIL